MLRRANSALPLPQLSVGEKWRYLWVRVGLVALLCGVCGGCTNLLLSPSRNRMKTHGEMETRVSLADGASVQVWTTRSAAAEGHEPKAYVLRFCGNGERAEDAGWSECQTWEDLPVEIWAMNYPGFGGSSGHGTMSAIPPAALATYDALRQQAGARPVFLSGANIGSAVSLYVATQRPAAGLILRSPPPIKEAVLGTGWWNLWLVAGPIAVQVPPQLDSIKNARRVTDPAVFVIEGNDHAVSRKYQRLVSAAYAGEKRVIVNEPTRHNSPAAGAAERKLESDLHWLWSRAMPSTRPATRHHVPAAPQTHP